jgi:hypothetical protein
MSRGLQLDWGKAMVGYGHIGWSPSWRRSHQHAEHDWLGLGLVLDQIEVQAIRASPPTPDPNASGVSETHDRRISPVTKCPLGVEPTRV